MGEAVIPRFARNDKLAIIPYLSFRGPNHGPRSAAEREGRGIPRTTYVAARQ